MKTLVCCVLLTAGMSCSKQSVDTDCVENLKAGCICNYIYQPVCGCNGKTYGNACIATCAGIRFTAGECGK